YGYLQVGLFEEGEIGDDNYGDIFYSTSEENCGQTKMLFRSGEAMRTYVKGTKAPKCNESNIGLPEEIAPNAIDNDNNGVPDYIDELVNGDVDTLKEYSETALAELFSDSDGDGLPDNEDNTDSSSDFMSNLSNVEENIDNVLNSVDNMIQGMSCGFGGGGCIATPLNWAPLAPGNDPTLFGMPIGDGLYVAEGIPVFSALTGFPGPFGIPIPAVWPPFPMGFPNYSTLGAGGYLGTTNPTNFFRLFVTPTLTGAVGVSACFGGPALLAGNIAFPGLSPLLPGGNCIVVTKTFSSCNDDGSDGDAGSTGFPVTGGFDSNGGFGIFNANCTGKKYDNEELDSNLVGTYFEYISDEGISETQKEKFKNDVVESFTQISSPSRTHNPSINSPLIQMPGQNTGESIDIELDFSAVKSGDFSDVIQIQNNRVSGFPDFLMGWVTRQIEEIVTKLSDFPTVFIILPDFDGILSAPEVDKEKFKDNISVTNLDNKKVFESELGGINGGIKETYSFLANLPLVTIQQETVSVEIPWVDGTELDNVLANGNKALEQREKEIDRFSDAWTFGAICEDTSSEEGGMTIEECEKVHEVKASFILETEGLLSALENNLEVIESYKDFPKDLNTLVHKKEEYLEQILCNIESISEILGGRIGSNGERFKTWVELYVLIKAILKSWQLMVDIFIDFNAECSECKNERGDLMEFIWKLISAVIPKIPVIQFPKWPDIILDLHNIRAGLTITLPEFDFGTRPILFSPIFPKLILPDVPSVGMNISLPQIPILPRIEIPELPDLPTLPTVELPNLPPPPILPPLFASLEGVLDILKLITKAMCILKTSPFVPEWRAGDQIAFLTERSGYLPMDFLDLSLPQFSYPFVDAIKVTSYVNLEFQTDFVTELVR
ncbi:hypothetical protein N8455_00755, partial [Candidatus Gracilibacteria bacterium]|nr:hypothetical protein [Candidatus Gracilibacteria bacterium]